MCVVKTLQGLLSEYKVDGYIIPSWDEFQNAYPSLTRSYLAYVSGFTGSYGIAVVIKDSALLFTDSRYILQASQEVNTDLFEVRNIAELSSWSQANSNYKLGYCGERFVQPQLQRFKAQKLEAISHNILEALWPTRPEPISNAPFTYPEKYAGSSYIQRLEKLRQHLKQQGADSLFVTAPENICWLLGVRGRDQDSVLTFASRMIITRNKVMVFSDVASDIRNMLDSDELESYALADLSDNLSQLEGNVIYDERSCSVALFEQISHLSKLGKEDPIYAMKACKTDIEVKNAINVHIQDAIAVCEFFAWLEHQVINNEPITEYEAGLQLTTFREQREGYICDSFASICGFASNGAIVHYRARQDDSKAIDSSSLLLVDSGGHYYGGTTDITRTICFGEATQEQKARYTDVLKGHIALSYAVLPKTVCASHLDIMARQYLWQNGLDYGHSTGHGVGNAINVHESPPHLYHGRKQTLKQGMIMSNEPGYYKDGCWGIRIENLMYVSRALNEGFIKFENLTLVPFAPNLINWHDISGREMTYLHEYYEAIKSLVMPRLSARGKDWCARSLHLPE